MTEHYRVPIATHRAAVQDIYHRSYVRLQARQHALMDLMWDINAALQSYETRERRAAEIQACQEAGRQARRAKRTGQPWPINDECRAGDHDECIPLHMTDGGVTRCVCLCHQRYPATDRTCWCSDARLRDSQRLWCRWLPLAWLRWIHENFGDWRCTPRWQAEMERAA